MAYLLSDTARLLRRNFDARVKQVGVTSPQARLLLILFKTEGENQGFYAERVEVEPITLCRMVDRMEEMQLVERRKDPADRRAWRLHLTERSRAMIERLREEVAELERDMMEGFTPEQASAFRALLERVQTNLADRPDSATDVAEAVNG